MVLLLKIAVCKERTVPIYSCVAKILQVLVSCLEHTCIESKSTTLLH